MSGDRLLVLEHAIDSIREEVERRVAHHQAACRTARCVGEAEPKADLPRASSAPHVRWAAKVLRDAECEPFYAEHVVHEAGLDIGVDGLLELPEFATLDSVDIEVRWSIRAIVERDVVEQRVVLGRAKPVSLEERLTWPGEGDAPLWRLTLSLPAMLLASDDERDRGLHALLCSLALRDDQPVLRRPDIVAHAATLGRYGTAGIREALAVGCAMRHPETQARMQEFGFDPASGQGLLWAPLERPEVH